MSTARLRPWHDYHRWVINDGRDEAPWFDGITRGQVSPLIESDEPIIRVQAGPGTGKTLGIRRRVLRLLHRDGLNVEPGRVLVCAFNRAIAKDLKEEIEAELGKHGLALPGIKTVHALCTEIAPSDARLLLQHEIEEMIYDVRTGHPRVQELYPTQAKGMRALREHEAEIESHPALITAVDNWLADHGAGLVGGAPRRVERALDQGVQPARRYAHVIVDEFQDLTATEAKVTVALREDGGHFVAVGDRKQSIYAFRGNAEKGLDALDDLIEGSIADHPMTECRRCPAQIVTLANAVMALENEPLTPVSDERGQLHMVHFATPDDEIRRIAGEALKGYLAEPTKKHLVLVTRRKWGYELKAAIRGLDASVPVETIFAEDVLQSWPAREAFIFLSILADPDDPVALRDWLAYKEDDAGKGFLAPERNAQAYGKLRQRVGAVTVEALRRLRGEPKATFTGRGRGLLYDRLHRLLELLDAFDAERPAEEIVRDVFNPELWIDFDPSSEEASLATDDLARLLAESLKLLEDDANLGQLVRRLRHRIATREPLGEEPKSGIRIVTLWGAKGLTADYVYVVGLADEALPGPWKRDETGHEESEHLDEQRRLLYVSLTRAKKCLVISRPEKIRVGKVKALGLTWRNPSGWWAYLRPCRFFANLPVGSIPSSEAGATWPGISVPEPSD